MARSCRLALGMSALPPIADMRLRPGRKLNFFFGRFVVEFGLIEAWCRNFVFFFLVICEEGGLMMGTQAAPERYVL